ncbi:MAG: heme ABC exporter ATP-binding protein CcmA [Acidobacteria bacterium]|nr:heme ABC exporter ATP-binding protein CcmA [Acidobacteriota bacterium]MCI0723989.1 heme ABC exporter ATP-binding protein CcmA [Acidobacteriota bacterium]
MADTPIVRLEKVEKWFGRTSALQGVDLAVQPGDFMVFLGRNGAGKSTLLRVVARLVRPNSGRVEVCGIDVLRHPEAGRERLGFVAHSSYLYRNLTAFENLQFFARLYNLNSANDRIHEALRWVGLEKSALRQVKGFSRGMQQRLSIARATLHNPEILLLDEPFSGLDLEASELLGEWLQSFAANGKTVLMATHDLEQGLAGARRWAFVDQGRIAEEVAGTDAEIRHWYKRFLKERQRDVS